MEETSRLKTGDLTKKQIDLILSHLPGEITFIDADDKIRFYTQHEKPIFKRTPDLIGLDVRVCHKPKSNEAIDEMVAKFKNKEASRGEAWINHDGRMIYIMYIAVYDENGEYMGIMEYDVDIGRIRKLRGTRKKTILS